MADLPAVTRRARLAACSSYRCVTVATRSACGDDARTAFPPPPLPDCLLGVLGCTSGGSDAWLLLPTGAQLPDGGGSGESRRRCVIRYGTYQAPAAPRSH